MARARLNAEIEHIHDALTDELEQDLHVKFVHDYVFDPKELQEAIEDGINTVYSPPGTRGSVGIASLPGVMKAIDVAATAGTKFSGPAGLTLLSNMIRKNANASTWFPKWNVLGFRPPAGSQVLSIVGNDGFSMASMGNQFTSWKYAVTAQFWHELKKPRWAADYAMLDLQGAMETTDGNISDNRNLTATMHRSMTRIHGLDSTGSRGTSRVFTGIGQPEDRRDSLGTDEQIVGDLGIPYFRRKVKDLLDIHLDLTVDTISENRRLANEHSVKVRIASKDKQMEAAALDKSTQFQTLLMHALQTAAAQIMIELKDRYTDNPSLLSASPGPVERGKSIGTRKIIKEIVAPFKKGKNKKIFRVTTTIAEPKVKMGKKSTKVKKKPKKNKIKSQAATAVVIASKLRRKSKKSIRRAPANMNPIALKSLIQKALPATIQKNMRLPALVNRTGRFARSAQVGSVVSHPKSLMIEYSYQDDPYRVFEPEGGHFLSSGARDPKQIIGGSIREIAQQLIGRKFGVIRTKRT